MNRGADLVVRALEVAGVKNVFTLSGNQIMPVFDACIDSNIELIHVRHEAAAVHMADAWGRSTGEPGIALVTAGPGFANMLSAMYVALMAESPLVVLSGHAPTNQLKRGAFQEMAQAEMAGHVAKASWTAADATQLGHDLARACRIASSGRPGPVHLSLPMDLLTTTFEGLRDLLPVADDFHPTISLLDVATAEEVLAAIAAAQKPLVLVGPSALRLTGGELLTALAEGIRVPVIGMESPRGINDPSLGAFAEVLAEADLITLIGKKLDFTLRFGDTSVIDPSCTFIHIDSDTSILEQTNRVLDEQVSRQRDAGNRPDRVPQTQSGRSPDDPVKARLLVTSLADALPALERLAQLAANRKWVEREWYRNVLSAVQFRPEKWTSCDSEQQEHLQAVQVLRHVQDVLAQYEDAVIISDGGEFGQWVQACLSASHRMINGPSGSIGSALPFALAARIAYPDSAVLAFLGDGTLGFHAMEFDTAARYELPFVVVVGNDACWNAEHQIQLRDYGRDRLIGCELAASRYDEVCRALGGHGEYVDEVSEVRPALERALESGKPSCVNIMIERIAAPTIRRNE